MTVLFHGVDDFGEATARMVANVSELLGRLGQIFPPVIPMIRERALRWAGH